MEQDAGFEVLKGLWQTQEMEEGFQPRETIRGRTMASLSWGEVSSTLPRLTEAGRDKPEVVLGDMLEEGGMGRVLRAKQPALKRDVVVKMLRVDRESEETKVQLLQESWLTGLLEHPNIVPVHMLGEDVQGRGRRNPIRFRRVRGACRASRVGGGRRV